MRGFHVVFRASHCLSRDTLYGRVKRQYSVIHDEYTGDLNKADQQPLSTFADRSCPCWI